MSATRAVATLHLAIDVATSPPGLDLDQAISPRRQSNRGNAPGRHATMDTVRWMITTAPEIFLLLAIAIGTILGRIKIRGFSIGTTACILIVAVLDRTARHFHLPADPASVPVQPVRLHDRLPVGAGVLCLPERPDAGAGRPGASARRHGPGARADLCSSVQARYRHSIRNRRRRTDPVLGHRHRIGRTGTARPA